MLSVSHYEGVNFASGEVLGYQPEFQSSASRIISIHDLRRAAALGTLAAAERLRDNFGPDSHIVLILCGGNIRLDDLFSYRNNVT
ncbi:MAG: hypothetical protein PSX80_06010 [bacterium]|nr:hypothetical protein [bacterium]